MRYSRMTALYMRRAERSRKLAVAKKGQILKPGLSKARHTTSRGSEKFDRPSGSKLDRLTRNEGVIKQVPLRIVYHCILLSDLRVDGDLDAKNCFRDVDRSNRIQVT